VCFSTSLPLYTARGGRAVRSMTQSSSRPPLRSLDMSGGKNKKKASAAGAKTGSGVGFGRPLPGTFRYTGRLRPTVLTPPRLVPEEIARPDYAKDGKPKNKHPKFPWVIETKTEEEIAKMRVSGRLAREVLDIAGLAVQAGVTTDEIDEIVHAATIERGAYPSPLYYHEFPKSCCTSVNEIVCHGIPDGTILVDGDIINVDVTVYYDGYHGDCSETYVVGNVDEAGKKLVRTTYECLERAMSLCKPDVPIKRIGGVIEEHAVANGLTVVRNFCGHGIGSVFHTTPNVVHYKNDDPAGLMKPGITFTIEPMVNEGVAKNVTWPDDWTAATADGKRSAQFEHTLLITDNGVEVLTAKLPDSPRFFWES
jgi:methionyl aminopeptidase